MVWSITTASAVTPSITPPAPRVTAFISGGPGTQVQMTSDCAATSFAESAQSAPRESRPVAASFLTSWITSGKPAFSTKPASGSPMFPRPMNPTRIVIPPRR